MSQRTTYLPFGTACQGVWLLHRITQFRR